MYAICLAWNIIYPFKGAHGCTMFYYIFQTFKKGAIMCSFFLWSSKIKILNKWKASKVGAIYIYIYIYNVINMFILAIGGS